MGYINITDTTRKETTRYIVKREGKYLAHNYTYTDKESPSLLNWLDTIDNAHIYCERDTVEIGAKIFGGYVVEVCIIEG